MWFEDFQDGCHGGHLGYQNETISAILNLHVAPMPFTKFPLYQTYCLGADNNWRISRWPWWPSWIRFWWRYRKCEKVTYGHTDEGRTIVNRPWHKLTWSKAPRDLTIEDLQDGCYVGHHGYQNNLVQHSITPMPPAKFWLNLTNR